MDNLGLGISTAVFRSGGKQEEELRGETMWTLLNYDGALSQTGGETEEDALRHC